MNYLKGISDFTPCTYSNLGVALETLEEYANAVKKYEKLIVSNSSINSLLSTLIEQEYTRIKVDPYIRKGQALSNAIVSYVRLPVEIDCYYLDNKIPETLKYLKDVLGIELSNL